MTIIRPKTVGMRVSSAVPLALLLACALSGCGTPDGASSGNSWGVGVVKQTDDFGDYQETIVSVPRPTAGPRQFQCSGPFAPNTSEINLMADFGQASITRAEVMEPGGSMAQGSVLLAGDPKLRVDVAWADAIDMVTPRRVAFTEESAWTVNGIGIGSGIGDLERANGRAFRIQPFSGGGGGVVSDWQGGRLGSLGNGCRLGVQLALPATASPQGRLTGPGFISSSDAAIRSARPIVGLFWVTYK